MTSVIPYPAEYRGDRALYFVRCAARVSPLRLARAMFFTQPSLYHLAGYGTKGAAADRRGYCRRQRWLWMVSERASAAPLPLIFAGEIQESAGGNEGANEGANVHYFSAASHDRFLARRRQTKIPPRKPRTELGFRKSASPGEEDSISSGSLLEYYILVRFCLPSQTAWLSGVSLGFEVSLT